MSDKFFVGLDITGFENNGKTRPISRVTLMVDDNNAITAGDDTGSELVADCPFATQEMVNTILANVKGYQYQMYSGDDAAIDPSFELGDGVTVGGIYSVISMVEDDGSGYATLSAPGEEELEDEYPSAGPMTQEFNRQIAQTKSYIEKNSEEIRLAIESITGEVTELKVTIDGVTITGPDGSTVIDGGKIDAKKLHVNAANIDGMLTANQIDATNLKVSAANITGSLTIGQLPSDVATDSDIPTKTSQLTNDSGYQNKTGVVSIVNGTVTADYVNALGISASVIRGEVVDLLDDLGRVIGSFTIEYSGLEGLKTVTLSSQELYFELTHADGGIYFYTQDGTGIRILGNELIYIEGDLRPRVDDYYWLGSSSRAWQDIYSVNDPTITSDRRLKNSITYNMDKYDVFFDNLRPTPYKLNNGTSGRTHLGLIAQDVEQALKYSNLSTMDFAGFIYSESDTNQESGNRYALRYGEFISLLIYEVQQLKKRVAELEAA